MNQTLLFYEYRGTYTYWWQVREVLKLAVKGKNMGFWLKVVRTLQGKEKGYVM